MAAFEVSTEGTSFDQPTLLEPRRPPRYSCSQGVPDGSYGLDIEAP